MTIAQATDTRVDIDSRNCFSPTPLDPKALHYGYPLLRIGTRPVAPPGHPLTSLGRPARRDDLEPHVQLVLSDPVDPCGANYGRSSARLWRLVDLRRQFDFLLAGFGWCCMPERLVAAPVADGRLIAIEIEDDPTPKEGLVSYAAHRRDHMLGPAGRWLLATLRQPLERQGIQGSYDCSAPTW